jgi:hypothetical protein
VYVSPVEIDAHPLILDSATTVPVSWDFEELLWYANVSDSKQEGLEMKKKMMSMRKEIEQVLP